MVGGVNTLLRLKMRVNGALDLNISVNLAVVAVYYMVDLYSQIRISWSFDREDREGERGRDGLGPSK